MIGPFTKEVDLAASYLSKPTSDGNSILFP
jgi:hypothetical protein